MIPVSEGFMKCLREGGTRVNRLYSVDEDLNQGFVLPVSEGQMMMNGTDSVRRSIDCTVWSDKLDLKPGGEESIVSVLGSEFQLMSGWLVNGSPELVPAGVFHLKGGRVVRDEKGVTITLSAFDRSIRVQRESTRPLSIRPVTPLPEAVEILVTSVYPECKFNFPDGDETRIPPLLFEARADLWQESWDLVESAGLSLFFDTIGQCSMSGPFKDLDKTFDLSFIDDIPVFGNISREVDKDGFYNGVIVYGTHSSGPVVVGQAWIEDPQSPYRIDGRMGKQPKIIESEKVGSIQQANALALAELRKMVTITDTVEFMTLPNPALDYGDVFKCDDPMSGASGQYYVTDYDFPMKATELMRVRGGRVLGGVTT